MCCGTGSHHGSWHWGHHHGGFCACGGPSRFGSCFSTKGEKVAWLERYLEGLRQEAKAVEERIAALKEEKQASELFAELRAGKSPAEVAEERGVEMETVYDAVSAARSEVMPQAIEQAVEDGRLSQEQADWLPKGLEQGLFPRGRGFGFGHGWGEDECPCDSH